MFPACCAERAADVGVGLIENQRIGPHHAVLDAGVEDHAADAELLVLARQREAQDFEEVEAGEREQHDRDLEPAAALGQGAAYSPYADSRQLAPVAPDGTIRWGTFYKTPAIQQKYEYLWSIGACRGTAPDIVATVTSNRLAGTPVVYDGVEVEPNDSAATATPTGVLGIGAKRFEKLKPELAVSGPTAECHAQGTGPATCGRETGNDRGAERPLVNSGVILRRGRRHRCARGRARTAARAHRPRAGRQRRVLRRRTRASALRKTR